MKPKKITIPTLGEVEVTQRSPTRFSFEYAEMYSPPDLSYALLRSWVEHFGTEKIDTTDHINEQGCETCDYGSKYGFHVIIEDATKNNPW